MRPNPPILYSLLEINVTMLQKPKKPYKSILFGCNAYCNVYRNNFSLCYSTLQQCNYKNFECYGTLLRVTFPYSYLIKPR